MLIAPNGLRAAQKSDLFAGGKTYLWFLHNGCIKSLLVLQHLQKSDFLFFYLFFSTFWQARKKKKTKIN